MSNNQNKTVAYLLAIIFTMLCLVVASVPLYNLFCKVTGYSGSARNASEQIIGRKEYRVTFNTNMPEDVDWDFKVLSKDIYTKSGENNLAIFELNNKSSKGVTAVALYNILPARAARYFTKVECFCYEELEFAAGSNNRLPVSFYLDSAIEQDPFLKNIDKITLSYSITTQN